MKTYIIQKSQRGFTPLQIRDGAKTSRQPIVQSDTRPTPQECSEAWAGFVPSTLTVSHVPRSITSWQARAALKLTANGQGGSLFESVEAMISAMPDGEEKVIVQTAWEHNADFERNSPTIGSLSAALGLSSDEIDELFVKASKLTV